MPDIMPVGAGCIEDITGSGKLSYFLFISKKCKHCQKVEDVLKEMRRKTEAIFCKVDITKEKEAIEKYSISEVPTVVVFRDDSIVGHFSGERIKLETFKQFHPNVILDSSM